MAWPMVGQLLYRPRGLYMAKQSGGLWRVARVLAKRNPDQLRRYFAARKEASLQRNWHELSRERLLSLINGDLRRRIVLSFI